MTGKTSAFLPTFYGIRDKLPLPAQMQVNAFLPFIITGRVHKYRVHVGYVMANVGDGLCDLNAFYWFQILGPIDSVVVKTQKCLHATRMVVSNHHIETIQSNKHSMMKQRKKLTTNI